MGDRSPKDKQKKKQQHQSELEMKRREKEEKLAKSRADGADKVVDPHKKVG
jgi:hypothetical protein